MKAVICLLAIVAGANAGLLGLGLGLGGIGLPIAPAPAPISSGWSSGGGYASGYSGYSSSVVPISKVIKVIEAPVQVVQPAPVQIVKIIRETQPGWSQPIVAPAPAYKILKVFGW